jgi:hypothetical protein
MSHRVRYVEISYDQDMDAGIDEEVLLRIIEDYMCPQYVHVKDVPEHQCPLIGISCRTEKYPTQEESDAAHVEWMKWFHGLTSEGS